MKKLYADDGSRVFKVVVLGANKAGKSALVNRAVGESFSDSYTETLGIELTNKETFTEDRERVTIELWSCGGHDRYVPIVQQNYVGVAGACLVFDVTNPISFEKCAFWRNEALRAFPEASLVLVGMKTDLVDDVQVPEDAGKAQAENWGITYFPVSAKSGDGVDALFASLLSSMSA